MDYKKTDEHTGSKDKLTGAAEVRTPFQPPDGEAGRRAVNQEEIGRHLRHGEKQIILDFGGLQQISSAGLRIVLLSAQKLHGSGGKLMLTNLGGNVKEVFDISGFTSWMFGDKGWIQKT